MSEVFRVTWTIIPQTPPQPWLHCSQCGGVRRFSSSDRIRVNANGKRVDAWLLYRCSSCGGTWNRPILERRHVRTIDPAYLAGLSRNDPALARRLAFDSEGLRHWTERLEHCGDVAVRKEPASANPAAVQRLAVLCIVPVPLALRIDRLLATELRLTRSRVHGLAAAGAVTISPGGPRALRRPVRDGMCLTIAVPADDGGRMAAAAAGDGQRANPDGGGLFRLHSP